MNAIAISPSEGLMAVLRYHFTRWGLRHTCWRSLAEADDILSSTATVVVADLDHVELPDSVLSCPRLRFIFLCSGSRRRTLSTDGSISRTCADFTVINKPLKRLALWRALLRRKGNNAGSSGSDALVRQQQRFYHGTAVPGAELLPAPAPTTPAASTTAEPAVTAPLVKPQERPRILVAEDNSVNVMASCQC